jgi:hypothetical protein
MRVAKPNELKSHAYPVLAATISEKELSKWFPVPFERITDPQEAAEPSKAALVRLNDGDCFVLYYGELSNQLTLRIPTSVEPSTFLSSLLREVPLPKARIIWRRQDARLPVHIAAKTITARRSGPAAAAAAAKSPSLKQAKRETKNSRRTG